MANYLVIVESPAKAKTIKKFLGRNYKVMASVGHVRDLPKSKMGVDLEDSFDPHYITIRGKGDVIKELRKTAKKADKIYLATDPDREGEAIAWHLKNLLDKGDKPFVRVTFNAITKEAVKHAIKHGRDIDMDLVDAQQARRVLDRVVGYSISPILWRKIRRGLSAGRVQSVATKMICDREREIDAFESEEYWSIIAQFSKQKQKIEAKLHSYQGNKIKISSRKEAEDILAKLTEQYRVTDVKTAQRRRNPAAPFMTSTLQQEAASRFGFSTKKTMSLAQQLYEGISVNRSTVGLITYMRTDSTRIAPEAVAEIKAHIEENYGKEYLGKGIKIKQGKTAQDAHEAIRPTQISLTPEQVADSLKADQLKLYRLIWQRAVASYMAAASYDQISLSIENNAYQFKASGSIQTFDGFLKVYRYSTSKDVIIPHVEIGELLDLKSMTPNQHFTQPPARYNEASLVKAMEELGIGRPSTYAPTISTILSRGYVGREQKSLYPTELGKLVNDILEDYFDDIIDVDFTANLERELDDVEADKREWKDVIKSFYGEFKKDLTKAEEELERIDLDEESDEVCEKCGAKMLIKHGRYGKFLACSNYPECENTKPYLIKIGVKCPKCQTGDVIERKTKKYRTFYGCSNYPACDFVSWHKPTGESCPECAEPLIDYVTKKKNEIICMNKSCSYKRSKDNN